MADTENRAVAENYDVALIQRLRVVPTILNILCDTTGLRYGAIGRVTETRWVACAVLDRLDFGLGVGGELDVETTFCRDVRASKNSLVIDGASEDPVYSSSLVPKQYGFEAYIAVPIVLANGEVWGTICGIDPLPTVLRGTQILPTLEMFAELLAGQIDNEHRLDASVAALGNERALGNLREQFIAILGHDLRNPLAAIQSGLTLLDRHPAPEKADYLRAHMHRSCARISGLIDDTMDFARARLGGGIVVQRTQTADLEADLDQVIQEVQAAHPNSPIRSETDIIGSVYCDGRRVGQLLSNLLANAVIHGAPDQPVTVTTRSREGGLRLSVANSGEQIPPAKMEGLFRPFERAGNGSSIQGLGLGLYIASEIARSHEGDLKATSSPAATVFTFEFPGCSPASAD